ncbi:MAG: HDOD domain-containing protein [Acidobacteriota bacterium]
MTLVPAHMTTKRKPSVAALPAFPAVARKLMLLVSQESSNMQEVSKLIKSDAVFSTEVLRLANSAVFGLRYEVISILHAMSVLGMDRLQALVLTVAMRDFFSTVRNEPLLRRCWRHNLSCALVAEWAAEFCWLDKSVSYTGGLLHSLGHLGMSALYPQEYQEAAYAAEPGQRQFVEMQRELTGTDHVEMAEWLVSEWGLPKLFCDLSKCHHAGTDIDTSTLYGLMGLSCEVSDQLGFSIIDRFDEWQPESFMERLPEARRWSVSARLAELPELIPFRVNVFEQEFLA